jgi:hypothetical protein
MGTGQQLLTIASIMLITLLIMNVHRATAERLTIMYSNEAIIAGTGVAQSLIDEIESKAFDQQTVSKEVSTTDSLTAPNALGAETGENTRTMFNDVDDYNNFTETDSLPRTGIYNIKVKVEYVANMNPSLISNYSTFTKKIDVFVTNFSLPDTLKFSDIVAY